MEPMYISLDHLSTDKKAMVYEKDGKYFWKVSGESYGPFENLSKAVRDARFRALK